MSSYTMPLRSFIEQATQDDLTLSTRERIEVGRKKLFDFDYPLFDQSYRKVFETNFIRNFYTREIGFETESLFQFQMETWLLINMPYFNKMFESELFKYDPMTNYDLSTTYTRTNNGTRNDSKDITQNNSKGLSQNDKRDVTQRDTKDRTQDDTIDTTQNDRIDKNQNATTNTATTNTSNQTSTIDGSSTNEGKSKTDTVNSKTNKDTITDDNFDRELTSDTGDGRLNITTDDGKGVITYANNIKENTENNKKINDSKVDGKDLTNIEESNLANTTQDSESYVEDVGNVSTQSELEDSETVNKTGNEMLSSRIGETATITTGETATIKVDETTTTVADEKLISEVNDVEEFVERKMGSAGVKTYPELIEGYRGILIRIEKQIFNEMNELFMLVY